VRLRTLWRPTSETRTDQAKVLVMPWQWPLNRIVGFGVLNAAIAAGVATGWHPPVVG
jgi:hypothetical protein